MRIPSAGVSSMVRSRVAIGLGVLAFVVGTGTILNPGIARSLPLPSSLVPVVGGVTLLAGIYAVRRWRRTDPQRSEPPAVETPAAYPTPGADIKQQLHGLTKSRTAKHRHTLRRRLTEVAIDTLRYNYGWSEARAEQALDEGDWTTDPHAAAYFTGEYPAWTEFRARVRGQLPLGGVSERQRALHVIEALATLDKDPSATPPRGGDR